MKRYYSSSEKRIYRRVEGIETSAIREAIRKSNISVRGLAEKLGMCNEGALYHKISGRYSFSEREANELYEILGRSSQLDFLVADIPIREGLHSISHVNPKGLNPTERAWHDLIQTYMLRLGDIIIGRALESRHRFSLVEDLEGLIKKYEAETSSKDRDQGPF